MERVCGGFANPDVFRLYLKPFVQMPTVCAEFQWTFGFLVLNVNDGYAGSPCLGRNHIDSIDYPLDVESCFWTRAKGALNINN